MTKRPLHGMSEVPGAKGALDLSGALVFAARVEFAPHVLGEAI